MAQETNHPYGKAQQGKEFEKRKKLEADVYDFIKETLVDSTEKAFKDVGMDDRKGHAGEYGDETVYGTGSKNDELTVNIAGRKRGYEGTPKDYLEKVIYLGGKKFIAEANFDIKAEAEIMDFTYSTDSQSFFRGHQDVEGGFMIEEKSSYNLSDMSKFKSEFKKNMKKYAEKEVGYITKTKIGIEDRTEKSINSMVENKMSNLSLKDMLSGSFEELGAKLGSINESKEEDENSPEVKDANTKDAPSGKKGNLLFDKKEDDKDVVDEEELDEVNASGGNAAGAAYPAKSAFATGGDFDDEMIGEMEKAGRKSVNEDKHMNSPYMQNQIAKPNFQFQRIDEAEGEPKGDKFWQVVDLNAGSGYVPKGMEKNHAMGQHESSDELGTEKEVNRGWSHKKTEAGKKKKINESTEVEVIMEEKDIRVVESRKNLNTTSDQTERWGQLVEHKTNETIKRAASVISDERSEMLSESRVATKETKEAVAIEQEKEKALEEARSMHREMGMEDGGTIDGEKVVIVKKPNSLTNVKYTVPEADYLNESMAFVWDYTTGNLVNNPNYKVK